MKLTSLLVFSGLFLGLSVSSAVNSTGEQERIEAVLALARASLAHGKEDEAEVLKNAMLLLADLNEKEPTFAALAELVAETQKSAENKDPTQDCIDFNAEERFLNYADRHARRLEEAAHDFDCMEREFDVSDPEFNSEEAALVLSKCRLLVLRNLFPKEMMEEYRKKYEDYVFAVHTGKIDKGKTKMTDARARDIVQYRGRKRHDIALPQWLAGEQIGGNPTVLEILRHEKTLGPDMVLNHIGSVISERDAPAMYWHADQDYIYEEDSFENSGIGGQDLLPYVLSLFIPLHPEPHPDHGPTEFCMGSAHITGLPWRPKMMNETLTEEGSPFNRVQDLAWEKVACPLGHWRAPVVGSGDAIIFDYNLWHRGGQNFSPEMRALLYVVYSRAWFRDLNFDNTPYSEEEGEENEKSEFEEFASGMRYTLIDESEVEHDPQAGTILSSVDNFAGILPEEDLEEEGSVEFALTNINVEGASLFVNGEFKAEIPPEKEYMVSASIGQELSARDEDGKVIRAWKVTPDQRQTILKQNL